MDGIDAAVVDVERFVDDAAETAAGANPVAPRPRIRVAVQSFVTVPYPKEIRSAIEVLLQETGRSEPGDRAPIPSLASLNAELGEVFADAAMLALEQTRGGADLIGSHGQTVCHQPRPDAASSLHPSTLQIGEPAIIAERTGITTVADFRVADVAAGGEGAPLVAYVDYLLLRSPDESRIALNIGGIANITVLPAGAAISQVRAFDTGPGNMPIDLTVRELFPDGPGYDRNGQIAARGAVHATLLEWLLGDPYFARLPPKTAGREQFGPKFVRRARDKARSLGCGREDLVATLTELTARTISAATPADCRRLIAAGGGVHNAALMGALTRQFAARDPAMHVGPADEFGLPADAKEAIAFAVLAYEAVHGRANNLAHATGASHPSVLGKVVPGGNFARLMSNIWQSRN